MDNEFNNVNIPEAENIPVDAAPVEEAVQAVEEAAAPVEEAVAQAAEEFAAPAEEAVQTVEEAITPAEEAIAPEAPVYTAAAVQAPQAPAAPQVPVGNLKTNRGLIKLILLTIITLGIYDLVVWTKLSSEIDVVAQRYDGKKTMNFCLLFFLIGPITLGIAYFVWFHKYCGRLGAELNRRGVSYSISSATFWLWCILGALIGVGPFVFMYKVLKASNLMNADYNTKG